MSHHRRVSVILILTILTVLSTLVVAAPAEAARRTLHRGSRGAAVLTLEKRLVVVAGLPRSAVDRRYRAATVRAVRHFQRIHHLRVNGRVNRRTARLVASAYRLATAPKARTNPAWAAPRVTAHRGGGAEVGKPENTLDSFVYGVQQQADVLELDVRQTSDHVLVVLHDDTLGRTTIDTNSSDPATCTGSVRTKTWPQLVANCRTRVGNQLIPSFDQVAEYVATTSVEMAPEIKDYAIDLTAFDDIVQQHALSARTYAQSFNPSIFDDLAAIDPALRPIYLSSTYVDPATVKAAGADIAAIDQIDLTAAKVATYRANDVSPWSWTARSRSELEAAWDMHVDNVITDDPALARSVLH